MTPFIGTVRRLRLEAFGVSETNARGGGHQVPPKEGVYVASARTALAVALTQLRLDAGQKILIPDFICDTLLNPIRQLGLVPEFYPLTTTLVPEWGRLDALVSSGSYRALVMVHYFGQPQDIGAFRRLCSRDRMYLIEDNAHGHGGHLGQRPLGTLGDVGISSPRKIVGTPSGGVLYGANAGSLEVVHGFAPFPVANAKSIFKLILRPSQALSIRVRGLLHRAHDWNDPRLFAERAQPDFGIDRFSRRIIEAIDWKAVAQRRRENWLGWARFAVANGLQSIFPVVHSESCPWAMPVYAEDSGQRNQWLQWGVKSGVPLFPWPPLPDSVIAENGATLARRQTMVCFPLDVGPADLQPPSSR